MKSFNRGRKIMDTERLYIELALQVKAHRFYVNNEQEMIEIIKKNDPFQDIPRFERIGKQILKDMGQLTAMFENR